MLIDVGAWEGLKSSPGQRSGLRQAHAMARYWTVLTGPYETNLTSESHTASWVEPSLPGGPVLYISGIRTGLLIARGLARMNNVLFES